MSADLDYDKMMAAMGMHTNMPWRPADFFFTFAMWAVMMVGMMAPSAAPMLLLFAATRAGRGKRSLPLTTLAYTWMINTHRPIEGVNLLILVIAVVVDLGGIGGGARQRSRR